MLGIQLEADCPVLDTPLRQLSELFSTLRAIVVGLRRKGTLFAPEPGDQLFSGDQIYVFTHVDDAGARWRSSARPPSAPERVLITRGGNVGLNVRGPLEKRGHPKKNDRVRTRVIEKSRLRAEVGGRRAGPDRRAPRRRADMDILREAGVDRVDAVLCVTDDDEDQLC